jgi:N-acetylneuraminic acid mutarotase
MKKITLTLLLLLFLRIAFAQYSWSNKQDFTGTARYEPTTFELNGKGYMIGGRTSSSPITYVNETWQYDPSHGLLKQTFLTLWHPIAALQLTARVM